MSGCDVVTTVPGAAVRATHKYDVERYRQYLTRIRADGVGSSMEPRMSMFLDPTLTVWADVMPVPERTVVRYGPMPYWARPLKSGDRPRSADTGTA